LVIHNQLPQVLGINDILEQLPTWNIRYLSLESDKEALIQNEVLQFNIQFIVLVKEISADILNTIKTIRNSNPLLPIIYYNSQIKDEEFAQLYLSGVNYCFVGDGRQLNLLKTLQKLWQNHWRRIPQGLLKNTDSQLSERAKKTLDFMETQPIKNLSSNQLAKLLNISESHFRLEFKNQFNQNFRDFKQQLLFHYESILLFEKNLKPREIFDLLNYKNLSAFSRSFKSRHGKSWQQMVRRTTF
jgi:AraC-like DNA-binding protein